MTNNDFPLDSIEYVIECQRLLREAEHVAKKIKSKSKRVQALLDVAAAWAQI